MEPRRPPGRPLAPAVLVLVVLLAAARGAPAGEAEDPRRPQAVAVENVPVVPDDLADRLRALRNVRQASFRGWSPDGKGMLVQTRLGDTAQLHRVFEPGGRREQVTFFEEPCDGRPLRGDPSRLVVSMCRGGDEDDQLFLLDVAGGAAPSLLTDGDSRNVAGPMSADGALLALTSNRRDPARNDLHVMDPRRPASARLLLRSEGENWTARDVAPDGKRLLVVDQVSVLRAHPFLVDAESGARKPLPVPGDRPAGFGRLRFAPDGRSAYAATDALGDVRRLARVDLETGAYAWLSDDLPWDVEEVEVEPVRGRVAFTVNADGRSRLFVLEAGARREIALPAGVVYDPEFSPDGARLGFGLARPDGPSDAWVASLEDGRLVRWTYSELGGLREQDLVPSTSFRYRSFDGREVPALIWRPRDASAERKAPVLIEIHGGPEGQVRRTFSPRAQLWAGDLGVAVIAPNVRGSTGYGRAYTALDDGMRREDAVRDVGSLLDWIAAQPDLDAGRVAVAGGSYGGYMVLASLVHHGSRLRAGVDVVGIASFVTFLERTAPYRRDLRRVEYGDERDPAMRAFFGRIDPLARAKEIRVPLLVAHGRNDPRVPFHEAEQIAAAVRANGGEVWTVYADNEGHGFAKKANRDYLDAVTVMFLLRHLKG